MTIRVSVNGTTPTGRKPLKAHIFNRAERDHYVEPAWCSARLFAVEQFTGSIVDPACGWGTIVVEALKAGYNAAGFDLVDRGWDAIPRDFLQSATMFDNIVTNPPFDILPEFVSHAVRHARRKVATIAEVRRLPAARWLQQLPLARILLLTPRPSMPSGSYIKAGGKVGGGTKDFCWLVFDRGHVGPASVGWLTRDGGG
jgi:hypothetical protein